MIDPQLPDCSSASSKTALTSDYVTTTTTQIATGFSDWIN